MSWVRKSVYSSVWPDTTSTMHRCKIKTATDDEWMSSWAGVKCRGWVTDSLNGRWSERCTLANVQSLESILFIHRSPHLIVHFALCQWVHCSVCYVFAVVESKGLQMRTPIRQGYYTVICSNNIELKLYFW